MPLWQRRFSFFAPEDNWPYGWEVPSFWRTDSVRGNLVFLLSRRVLRGTASYIGCLDCETGLAPARTKLPDLRRGAEQAKNIPTISSLHLDLFFVMPRHFA